MIKTKQIFQPEDVSDGTRILITHGISDKLKNFHFDEHVSALGPSLTLLNDYRYKGISWSEYEKRFIEEMKSPRSRIAIVEFAKRSLHGETITLLCYEKEQNPHCHRHIIGRLVIEEESRLKSKEIANET